MEGSRAARRQSVGRTAKQGEAGRPKDTTAAIPDVHKIIGWIPPSRVRDPADDLPLAPLARTTAFDRDFCSIVYGVELSSEHDRPP
jgi:hypothetical protein